ncbi:putative feruloyl esterase [Eremomyces bilateralis CBS 781.70]|uniref:Carboxylic ester hydrolase n=1 Tax=Eremomyces bilateralis CBS 781.70 TaxID=1392243 RepID=A0A6G1G081_9PEZI|nr:putative feruloyl esterase [Eremomyces bilateralis CBS 781.70]KAF1811428.1 putative feruloyl esterase [Eremomyces bilateralis CBS 781.70]
MIPSLFNGSISADACSASLIPYPTLFGAEFLSLDANFVSNYTNNVHIGLYANHGGVNVENVDFCNVTASYTHPGVNDTIYIQVWMPSDTWNGRPQAIGGAVAVGEGYATVGTDAGLGSDVDPTNWGLLCEGNPNLHLLQNLASVSLNDVSVVAKSTVKSFYGQLPAYSYFSGCSQGGRQGLMLAQRYPDAYDGIAASAPAINWAEFFVSFLWPAFLMDLHGQYPPSCEIEALTGAAIASCDGEDGVIDGVITNPETCTFDPTSLVGKWTGAKRVDNSSIWFGVGKDAQLTDSTIQRGIASTTCTSNRTCTPNELELGTNWVKLFIQRSPTATTRFLTHEDKRGGKLSDSVIPTRESEDYYDRIAAVDPNVQDYYRLFLAPGLGHCFGGSGAYPDTTFDALREWVENGIAPETVAATSVSTSPVIKRPLCPYPKKQIYDGIGDSTAGKGFHCV